MKMIFLSEMFPWPTVISAPGEEFTASLGRGVSRTSSRASLTYFLNKYVYIKQAGAELCQAQH